MIFDRYQRHGQPDDPGKSYSRQTGSTQPDIGVAIASGPDRVNTG
jgi:hypothetical protein